MRNIKYEQVTSSERAEVGSFTDRLSAPLLYLSSEQADWGDLVANAFFEPTQIQGWKSETTSGATLMLLAGGPLHVDRHYEDGHTTTDVMREGDLVLTSDVVGPYLVSSYSLSSIPTRTFCLHLSYGLLARTAEDLGDRDLSRLSLTGRERFEDPLLRQIALALWKELEESTPAWKLYAQAAAQILAVHILRHYTSSPIRIEEVSHLLTRRQLKRILDFVSADPGRDLTLEAMAEQVGFSPYHFARLFRHTTGESPHQFVLRQRIEAVQRLLRETDAPLAQIALESGFANQSHLTRTFKRYLGVTPKAYRLTS